MLYIAQPYVHNYLPIREERYRNALKVLFDFHKAGILAYSPIVHWHPVDVTYSRGVTREYLMEHSKLMVKLCWGLVVVEMNGWMNSEGVYAEYKVAKKYDKFTGLLDWRKLSNDGNIIVKPLGDYRKGGYGQVSTRTWGPGQLAELYKEARPNPAYSYKQKK